MNQPRTATPQKLVRMSDIVEKQIHWLSPTAGIPLGGITVLVGAGGCGKTLLCILMAARVSRGEPILPDDPRCEPSTVFFITAEDSLEHVLKPRLRLARAEMSNVFSIDLGQTDFTLPTGLKDLESRIAELAPRLVVIDPISAFLGAGIDSHKDTSLRTMLRPIHALAEKHQISIVCVLHTNKSDSVDVTRRTNGSVAWNNAARNVIAFGRKPNTSATDNSRIAAIAKANYGITGRAHEFTLVVPEGEQHPLLQYVRRSEVSVESLLSQPDPAAARKVDEAAEFLLNHLSDGPKASKDVEHAAKAQGIRQHTLERARKELGVLSKPDGFQGPFVLSLPVDNPIPSGKEAQ